jgi:hypothetical protein
VHHASYLPEPELNGFSVAPGVETSMAAVSRFIERAGWPYDGTNCANELDAQYFNSSLR